VLADQLLDLIAAFGMTRGNNQLQIWMACVQPVEGVQYLFIFLSVWETVD